MSENETGAEVQEAPAEARKRHADLSLEITEADHRYYILDSPTLSGLLLAGTPDMTTKKKADNKTQGSGGDQGGRSKGSSKKEQGRKSSGNKKSGT